MLGRDGTRALTVPVRRAGRTKRRARRLAGRRVTDFAFRARCGTVRVRVNGVA